MSLPCVRSGCRGAAVASWWRLCVDCTAPLLTPVTGAARAGDDSDAGVGADGPAAGPVAGDRVGGNVVGGDVVDGNEAGGDVVGGDGFRGNGFTGSGVGGDDQRAAAGWDAVAWAERIAPRRWGHAVSDDSWLTAVRCVAFASVTTGRADGCEHTRTAGAVPVVAVPRATGTLRCPPCAEPVVASVTTDGHACDRCGRTPVTAAQRVAAVVGASLVVVAQLCDGCARAVLAFGIAEPDVG